MPNAAVHLLDVGHIEYGDSILCVVGAQSILLDGGKKQSGKKTLSGPVQHRPIQDQIKTILGQTGTAQVDLLVMTHCHSDHIGCLPRLIDEGLLACDWALMADPDLGFGRFETDSDEPPTDRMPLARKLAFSLREEPLGGLTDSELAAAIEDQAGQYEEYVGLLSALQSKIGGRLVLYRGPAEAESPGLSALLAEFAPAGLTILGPEPGQLGRCAEVIRNRFIDSVADAERRLRTDAAISPATLYREMLANRQDDGEADASVDGKALNCQSIVMSLEAEGRRVLLTGDMQFAAPGLGPDVLADVKALIAAVTAGGPYDFIKLAHHASDNGFNKAQRVAWGAKLFGISTGANSGAHPRLPVMNLLQATPNAKWIRNDRNGLCSFDFSDGGASLTVERGALNDPSGPAGADSAVASAPPPAPEIRIVETERPAGDGMIEVTARIPNRKTRVTITIDVAPGSEPPGSFPEPAAPDLGLGGGRRLPRLLFVTNPAALARNIGQTEALAALAAIRARHDLLEIGESQAPAAMQRVRQALAANLDLAGVVLVGGYDVVPSCVLDALPAALRQSIVFEEDDDADGYIVWSDDGYGDRDGDGNPELPVSRVPDGCSSRLLRSALQARLPERFEGRCGVRNLFRPFAEGVFAALPGTRALVSSDPLRRLAASPAVLTGDLLYLMLHGDAADGRVFSGEDQRRRHHPAIDLGHLPEPAPAVVLSGACWGALIVDTPAFAYTPGAATGVRGPDQSIALRCLERGANAFVGCTGSHYSPRPGEPSGFGQPMHRYFFESLLSGRPPAAALFEAKRKYSQSLPHSGLEEDRAIENKILRQFTCLGLGW